MQAIQHHIFASVVDTCHANQGRGGFAIHHLIDQRLVLQLHGRFLGNDDAAGIGGGYPQGARRSAMQQTSLVGKDSAGRHRTRLPVDDSADALHTSLLPVGRAVVQHQFHLGQLFQRLVHRTVLARQGKQLVFGHGEIDIHRGVVRHGGQWLGYGWAHQGTRPIGQCAYHAIAGSLHFGIREVVAGVYLLRLGLRQLCLCRVVAVFHRQQVHF